ncbi:hypothetical protein VMCG_10676 [Cytospora schulzeri]|uniref:CFEM domain-containing protein n=1 Tax=Cytospora schulzeri TaxID=448051 RepID=A0A423VAM7_9PEZI|nr:hypothetical protein VMCG_10676 [Valsa malicola]
MKLSIFTLAAAACLVSSQCISSIPECAQTCLLSAASSVGCAADDYTCQCSSDNQSGIQEAATSCVSDGCGIDAALQQVLPAAETFCSAINAGQTCSSSSASAVISTTSSLPEPTFTSTSTEVTGAVTTTTDSFVSSSSPNTTLSSTISLIASTTGNATVTATKSSSSSKSSAASGSGSSSGTATGATSSSSSTAAAVPVVPAGSIGSFAMMILGALALF